MSRGLYLTGAGIIAVGITVAIEIGGGPYILGGIACVCVSVLAAKLLSVWAKYVERRPQSRGVPMEWREPKREKAKLVEKPRETRQIII